MSMSAADERCDEHIPTAVAAVADDEDVCPTTNH